MNKILRPFLNYHGSKWREARHYPEPKFDTIIEPFAGGAGYSLHYADRNVVLVDKNPDVAAVWNYLIHVSEDEIMALPDLEVGQLITELDIPAAAQILIGWASGSALAYPMKKPSNWWIKFERKYTAGGWGPARRERIAGQLESIRHWKVIHGEYSSVANVEATWFIDPPYQTKGRRYPFNQRKIDFTDLRYWCLSRRGQSLVCEHSSQTWIEAQPFRASRAQVGTCDEVLYESINA